MATFAERAANAQDAAFRSRVSIALTRVALRMSDEAQPTQTWTRKRVELATLVLRDPQASTVRFALILASMDVPLSASDDELETLTRQAWDAVAGVAVEDRNG